MSTTRLVNFKGESIDTENGRFIVERVDGSPKSVAYYEGSKLVAKISGYYGSLEVTVPEPPPTRKVWSFIGYESGEAVETMIRCTGYETEAKAKKAAEILGLDCVEFNESEIEAAIGDDGFVSYI